MADYQVGGSGPLIIVGKVVKFDNTMEFAGTDSTVVTFAGVSSTVPGEVATIDLTAQGASIGATTAYAVPAAGAGMYRVSYYAKVTTTASVSSTLGALTVTSTDPDSNVASQVGTTSTNDSVTTGVISGTFMCYCKASTNIQYAMAYVSSPATVMRYNLHIKVEAL